MVNLHKLLGAIANEQGIEPGSTQWVDGGIAAYSGQTGSHPAYGWKHEHKLTPDWARAVIANYAHRRCYYLNEPKRKIGYGAAGRPVVWAPEDSQDMTSGEVAYLTSKGVCLVSGPDVLHYHIGPLCHVFDSDLEIKALGQMHPAKLVAGVLIQHIMASLAGMIRGGPITYLHGDRGAANIIKASVWAGKRGLVFPEDANTINEWVMKTMLPFYEKGPGHDYGVKGVKAFQLYNGLYWTLPAFYDLMVLLPDGELKTRLSKIVTRQATWVQDVQKMRPDLNVYQLDIVDDAILKLPEAPLHVTPYVKLPANVGTGTDWGLWGYRAGKVAAKVLNDTALDQAMVPIFEKFAKVTKYDNKPWLVDADGNYAV